MDFPDGAALDDPISAMPTGNPPILSVSDAQRKRKSCQWASTRVEESLPICAMSQLENIIGGQEIKKKTHTKESFTRARPICDLQELRVPTRPLTVYAPAAGCQFLVLPRSYPAVVSRRPAVGSPAE